MILGVSQVNFDNILSVELAILIRVGIILKKIWNRCRIEIEGWIGGTGG